MKPKFVLALPLFAAALLPGVAVADVIYNVSIGTAPLISDAAGPFSLDFQFTDGSGANDGNNSIVVNNFSFGAGAVTGSPSISGSVTGDIAGGFTMTDSAFFNEFLQGFTPGATLGFTVRLTTNIDAGGVPDEFSFAILDHTGAEIPTLGPFDVMLLADINSSNPSLLGFASDTSRNPAGGGAPISLGAPVVTSAVPEPSAGWLLLGAVAMLTGRARSRSKSRGRDPGM